MASRRKFIQLGALSLPLLGKVSAAFSKSPLSSTAATKPVVISTWDSGVTANNAAWEVLKKGGKALDAVEQAGIAIENDGGCCVGLMANPDRDGHVTLDACIMDEQANCGSVAFLERIKHPVSVARKVMELTPHVMLVGSGAQQFALENGFKLEPDVLSPDAAETYRKWLKKSEYKPVINIENSKPAQKKGHGPFAPSYFDDGTPNHDTMGTVAIDSNGRLSGMCTTSGMAFKMRGRLGDSPIIGSGLFVDNEAGAAVATGQGEEVIRVAGTHLVVEFMRQGLSPEEACRKAVERVVKRNPEKAKDFQVAFVAINKAGDVGGYAIQKGFSYTVTKDETGPKVIKAKSYFA
ncbi:N(4)-(beta-N-acetylglucosaminyl)-L-asparaginase [Arsenicibacter rosenii]|uniref:Glycosylasparaginase n=1 Tax=Arsenicibacter rosenii TaxID=1750698 RepID=A0A1S2VPJ2_9BACT|nr:N(4)-(beta-N-acetylglucosaminyl)-L-asparaginase [Arsenicibacter rosenii]OIN60679.1 glycosylasparaginase [Arsenicibacter rosenii]